MTDIIKSRLSVLSQIHELELETQQTKANPEYANFVSYAKAKKVKDTAKSSTNAYINANETIKQYSYFATNPDKYHDLLFLPQKSKRLLDLKKELQKLDELPSLTLDSFNRSQDDVGVVYSLHKNSNQVHLIESIADDFGAIIYDATLANAPSRTQKYPIKVGVIMVVRMVKEGEDDFIKATYSSKQYTCYNMSEVGETAENVMGDIINKFTNEETVKSGCIFHSIIRFDIQVTYTEGLRGGAWLPLPSNLSRLQCFINPKNMGDNDCFKYAILSAVFYKEIGDNNTRISKIIKYDPGFVWPTYDSDTGMLINSSMLSSFEHDNDCTLFIYNKYKQLVYATKKVGGSKYTVYLLHYDNEDDVNSPGHFVAITKLHSFLKNSTNRSYNGICPGCHKNFYTQEQALEHYHISCYKTGITVRNFNVDKHMNLKSYFKSYQPVPFNIIYDFESTLTPCDDGSIEHKPWTYTLMLQFIEWPEYDSSVKFRASHDEYTQSQVINNFIDDVNELYEYGCEVLANYRQEMDMTTVDRCRPDDNICEVCLVDYETAKKEHYDKETKAIKRATYFNKEAPQRVSFEAPEHYLVMDHNHMTGKFRFWCCKSCNKILEVPVQPRIPVIAHNASNYDNNLILKQYVDRTVKTKLDELNSVSNTLTNEEYQVKYAEIMDESLNCSTISKNSENVDFFTLGKLVFKDSFQFMGMPLADAVQYCKVGEGDDKRSIYELPTLRRAIKELGRYNEEQQRELYEIMSSKMHFPYSYFTTADKINGVECPGIEYFNEDINNPNLEKTEYDKVTQFYSKYCRNVCDFVELYNISDVCILADALQAFRKICMNMGCGTMPGLDPLTAFTSAGASWNRTLQHYHRNGHTIELIQDSEMFDFFEIKGGNSYIPHRYAKANYPSLEDYKPNEELCFLLGLDATSLYPSTCYKFKLPCGDMKWEKRGTFTTVEDILNIPEDGDIGYNFEVDLDYSIELQEKTKDLPLLLVKYLVDMNKDLSEVNQKMYTVERNGKTIIEHTPTEKLTPVQFNVKNYKCHYRMLQLLLRLGMTLVKVNRVVSYKQEYILREYMEDGAKQRKLATTKSQKDVIKLFMNSTYGRHGMDKTKFCNSFLTMNSKQVRQSAGDPRFVSKTDVNEDLKLVRMLHSSTKMDMPVYIASAILDLSKVIMYDYWYNNLKAEFPQAKLLMTDTDSMFVSISFPNDLSMSDEEKNGLLTNRILNNKGLHDIMDYSAFPKDHPLYSSVNENKLGTFKDESKGMELLEFVGLRSKSYSYRTTAMKENKETKEKTKYVEDVCKGKGVPKKVLSKNAVFNTYKTVLESTQDVSYDFNAFTMKNFTIKTQKMSKVAICSSDDKRYFLDNINSTPIGYYKNESNQEVRTLELH